MRERLERIAVMPFTITCATPSSIAIKEPQRIRKPSGDSIPCSPANKSEFKYGNAATHSLEPSNLFKRTVFLSATSSRKFHVHIFSFKSYISSKLQRLIKSALPDFRLQEGGGERDADWLSLFAFFYLI